jgi:hypothetical protein
VERVTGGSEDAARVAEYGKLSPPRLLSPRHLLVKRATGAVFGLSPDVCVYAQSRDGRPINRLASSSLGNVCDTGSKVSFRFSIHDIAAAWQATCEFRITSALATVGFRVLMLSKKLRACAETSSPFTFAAAA